MSTWAIERGAPGGQECGFQVDTGTPAEKRKNGAGFDGRFAFEQEKPSGGDDQKKENKLRKKGRGEVRNDSRQQTKSKRKMGTEKMSGPRSSTEVQPQNRRGNLEDCDGFSRKN